MFDPTQRNTCALLMGGGFRQSLSRTSGKRMTMVQATDSDTTTADNVRPFPGTAPEPPTRSDARPLLRDWGRAATEPSPARPRAPSVRRGAEVLSYTALSARSSCKRLSSSAGSSCRPVPARCVVRGYSPLPVLAGGAACHHHSSGNADMPYFGMFLGWPNLSQRAVRRWPKFQCGTT